MLVKCVNRGALDPAKYVWGYVLTAAAAARTSSVAFLYGIMARDHTLRYNA